MTHLLSYTEGILIHLYFCGSPCWGEHGDHPLRDGTKTPSLTWRLLSFCLLFVLSEPFSSLLLFATTHGCGTHLQLLVRS